MTADAGVTQEAGKPGPPWFRIFKYTMYALLAFNVALWFREDMGAASVTFADGVSWRNFVPAYSATVDTLAWVILLLMFELETAVISDEKLRGGLKWVLAAMRAVCYAFIVYSFIGYLQKYGLITSLVPLGSVDPCALLSQGYTLIESLDEYPPLTAETCLALSPGPILQVEGTPILGTPDSTELARRLALTDVINAGNWLIIVVLLEIEVLLQLKGRLTPVLMLSGKAVKAVLYSVLLGCAVYWGIDGTFLDFWDAFLWLVAFVFIEMNIFEWNAETRASEVVAL